MPYTTDACERISTLKHWVEIAIANSAKQLGSAMVAAFSEAAAKIRPTMTYGRPRRVYNRFGQRVW